MAQNNLGMLYHAGKGVPVDYLKAIKWYNQAAQKVCPTPRIISQSCLPLEKGFLDYLKAYAWLIVAKANGINNEAFMDYLSSKLPSDQISSAQTLAGKLLTALK